VSWMAYGSNGKDRLVYCRVKPSKHEERFGDIMKNRSTWFNLVDNCTVHEQGHVAFIPTLAQTDSPRQRPSLMRGGARIDT